MGAAPLAPEASIFDVYEVGALLGSGAFGQVRDCWPVRDTARRYAVKIVDTKSEVLQQAAPYLSARHEAEILRTVQHPHIVELIDIFEEEQWLFLVMECVTGGELFAVLSDPQVTVGEGSVATVGRQLLQALRHLHDHRVVHRDVKAENILLVSNPKKVHHWHIKLIDFGLAMRMEQPAYIFRLCKEQDVPLEELICGTAYYCAPEVWFNDYGPRVDVWAAGVVLYLALYGVYPYYDKDVNALETLICNPSSAPAFEPVCANECPGYQVSPDAKRCLVALLEKDQENRPDAATALSMPWLHQTKRSRSMEVFSRKPFGESNHTRLNSICGGESKLVGDQPVPVAVRVRAGRAAARPPVEAEKEQSRTDALEALRVRVALTSPGKGGKPTPHDLWTHPIEERAGATIPVATLADTSFTDSDVEDGTPFCTCR